MSDSEREARHERGKCLTIDGVELGSLIGRSIASVIRDDDTGRIPASVRIGAHRRWVVAEIEAWLLHGCPDRAAWAPVWAELRREMILGKMKGPVQ